MEQSHSKKLIVTEPTQEIPRLLRNPKVHYSVHKSPPLVSILSQMNTIHTFKHYVINIILSSTPRSSKWPCSWQDVVKWIKNESTRRT
jgi:hypothetical protein